MFTRTNTKKIRVGNLTIGGDNTVVIQSMITHKPRDIDACVQDINALEKAGCQLVRFTCLTLEDCYAITEIKKQTNVALVADIHFDYKLAIAAIEAGVDKIRINPGNIGSDENVKKVVNKCLEYNIPIRIGVNNGSLEKHLIEEYGRNSEVALVKSAMHHIKLLEENNFYNIIVSIKASDPLLAIKAYQLAAESFDYPLHLGITESGTQFSGTIKSSAALGVLLHQGIGSTIRVSLTADPVEEIKVCRELLACFELIKKPRIISCPTCGRCEIDLIKLANQVEEYLFSVNKDISVAVMGCVVNGPGEASDADIGIAGGFKNARLFKKGEIIRTVDEKDLFDELKKEIDLM